MIYSRWRPDGGYDYFETPERRNIGDDLPTPQLPGSAGGIGVPAQECGRAMPSGARQVGRGHIPQGLIAPSAQGGAMSGTVSVDVSVSTSLAALLCGAVVGYFAYPWLRRQL